MVGDTNMNKPRCSHPVVWIYLAAAHTALVSVLVSLVLAFHHATPVLSTIGLVVASVLTFGLLVRQIFCVCRDQSLAQTGYIMLGLSVSFVATAVACLRLYDHHRGPVLYSSTVSFGCHGLALIAYQLGVPQPSNTRPSPARLESVCCLNDGFSFGAGENFVAGTSLLSSASPGIATQGKIVGLPAYSESARKMEPPTYFESTKEKSDRNLPTYL